MFRVDDKIVNVELENGKAEDVNEEAIETPAEEVNCGQWSAVYFNVSASRGQLSDH